MITIKFICETSTQENKADESFIEFFEENFNSLLEKFSIINIPIKMTRQEGGIIEIYLQ